MKPLLFLLLLLPPGLFAQDLPDTAVAARMHVKRLIVLRCEEGQPVDTEAVYRFDEQGWFPDTKTPLRRKPPVADSMKILVRDEKGRVALSGFKYEKRYDRTKTRIDTNYTKFFYDANDRVLRTEHYEGRLGLAFVTDYAYDATGHLSVKTYTPTHPFSVTKTEFHFNPSGQLVSVITWWSWFPQNDGEAPPDADTRTSKIVYTYDANGLITEAHAEDPTHNKYCLFEEGTPVVDKVTFRYIYSYQ